MTDGNNPIEAAARDALAAERATPMPAPAPETESGPRRPPDGRTRPGTAVAVLTDEELAEILQPHALDLRGWVTALMTDSDFEEDTEVDPAYAMMASILSAETSEEVFAAMDVKKAKEMCGGEPGGHSPRLLITDARPLQSTFQEGPSCFVIVSATYKADGTKVKFTTGARAVQAAIIKHMHAGWMPIDCVMTIRKTPTRAGFYPLNLEAGG